MSADAKMWKDGEGWLEWRGIHDGDCKDPQGHPPSTLTDLLHGIEQCMGCQMRWEVRIYPDGKVGLRGFTW